jgi:exodeoxyribonuclease V beta subunit
LISGDGNVENIVYCQLEESENGDGSWSATEAGSHARNWITAEISSLLGDPGGSFIESAGQAGNIVAARVKPADIAILVRSNRQAEEYRDDLRRLDIPAVLASKITVFSTVECTDLRMILQAIQSPASSRALKAALTCDWFGLSGNEHFQTCSDDRLFSLRQDAFQRYHEHWRQAGFLPMFREFLEHERVYFRLGQLQGGERRITNIEHLAELVQEAELNNGYRISQTVQWLQEAAEGADLTDEVELRLESDAEGVTILTMHGAKGLEFPIVFCPSLLAASYPRDDAQIAFSHDENGERTCDLGSVSFARNYDAAIAEERDEDMRLAYVAITRATLRVYLFWADIKKWGKRPSSFDSPLGIMLFPQGRSTFAEQRHSLLDKAGRNDCGYRLVQQTRTAAPYRTALNDHGRFRPRVRSERVLLTSRTRTSFSGLARLTSHEETLAGAFDEIPLIASREAVEGATDDSRQKAVLPGGVRFGNIVHDLLERLTFKEIEAGSYAKELLDSLGRHYNLVIDPTDLARLLHSTVQTKLLEDVNGDTFRLTDLDEQHLVKEMGFTLALERLQAKTINDLLSIDPAFTPLSAKTIEGYITGYIDLICIFNDRYYVIDYKTNYLGNDAGQYNPERLIQAMRSHNYGLQYWLYTLVVHRHLRRWNPSYRYADHFGGVMYLFVRGMADDVPGSGVYFTRPDESVLPRLDEKLGGGVDV